MVVSHLCAEGSARELLGHELRWGRTVRLIDPVGYAGSLVTHPLPLALAGGALVGFPPIAAALIFAIVLVRLALKACVDLGVGQRAGAWWLMPLRDLLAFGVFVASFAVNTVGWQGRRFRILPGGVLAPC
ncbi:MAG: hypothetical protein JOZ27_00805, partial [Caulobacteraceae bacterium]|nr:hypothetical protein [Caulobacteraceae bacterium]